MDHYLIWCDLKDSHRDMQFSQAMSQWMGHLKERGLIEGYTLTRRKLGFGPAELGEFMIDIAVRDMAQLDQAFSLAATRAGQTEKVHGGVYSMITGFRAALYREFPDSVRSEKL
jgi:hypothetical protein